MCVSKHSTWMNPLASTGLRILRYATLFRSRRGVSSRRPPVCPMFKVRGEDLVSSYSHYLESLKTKNPRVFNPRVLEVCCVNLCVTRQSSGPLKSLVYDHMIDFRH